MRPTFLSCRSSCWAKASQRRSAAGLGLPGRSHDGLWANATFEELGVHQALVHALAARDILRPTVVQAESFAPLARGRDVALRAETGSGKTLAYLLPMVNRIYHLHDRFRTAAATDPDAPNPLRSSRPWVVLAPTSDLCAQVLAMLETVDVDRLVIPQSLQRLCRWDAAVRSSSGVDGFREPRPKESTMLLSGAGGSDSAAPGPERPGWAAAVSPYAAASPRIRWGSVDVVVSTPAKFREELQQLTEDKLFPACIVLDEADALFQGPSRRDLFDIFGALRPRLKIRQLGEARERLPDLIPTQFVFSAATMVHIGPFSAGNMILERFSTAQTVETQHFHRLPTGISLDTVDWRTGSDVWDDRVDQLLDALRAVPCERTLVFVNSLHNCHVLGKFLRQAGWPVVTYMKGPQGRMGPRFRDAKRFVEGEANIMIATEFGGRGIDWVDVDHVVNFQMPTNAVCWLHRIGRTARMGKRGLVTNFVGSKDTVLAELIRARLQAGKDLHGAFSRRRSLRSKLRARQAEEEEQANEAGASSQSSGGGVKLDGGLELLSTVAGAEGAAEGAEERGTLIGYLESVEDVEEEPKKVGKRYPIFLDEKKAWARGRKRGGQVDDATLDEEDEEVSDLLKLRTQLLASDSEDSASSDEGERDEDAEGEKAGSPRFSSRERETSTGRTLAQRPFTWSQIDERSEAGALAPPPSRQILNRASRREEQPAGGRAQRRSGRSRGPSVKASSRAAAGRNYAAPDDDLLL